MNLVFEEKKSSRKQGFSSFRKEAFVKPRYWLEDQTNERVFIWRKLSKNTFWECSTFCLWRLKALSNWYLVLGQKFHATWIAFPLDLTQCKQPGPINFKKILHKGIKFTISIVFYSKNVTFILFLTNFGNFYSQILNFFEK